MQTYQCPRCRTTFSSLDAIQLLDPASQLFLCDNCGCVRHFHGSTRGMSSSTLIRAGLLETTLCHALRLDVGFQYGCCPVLHQR